jgi:hypothetical protein
LRAHDLFTVSIALALIGALIIAWDWPLRASIIILTLGTIGLVLISLQLFQDYKRKDSADKAKLVYELPTIKDTDTKASRRGTLEIWGWLFGLLIAIRLFGLPFTLPVFVFAYAKVYGASWLISIILAGFIAGFEFGIYEQIVHVYWPDPLILELFR